MDKKTNLIVIDAEVKKSASIYTDNGYIVILNNLTKENIITNNEYEKSEIKLKKRWETWRYIEKEMFLTYNKTCNWQEGGKMAEVQIIEKVKGRIDRSKGTIINGPIRVAAYARVSTNM